MTSRSSRAPSPHRKTPCVSGRRAPLSHRLVTIGACATAGGIQALRNFADVEEYLSVVYAIGKFISTLKYVHADLYHARVDFELRGCPIDQRQLLEVINVFLHRRRPNVPDHSVCIECKARGNLCVMVAGTAPCLGPVTYAGCGARAPEGDERGCYGCFGPMESPTRHRWRAGWAVWECRRTASSVSSAR